MKYLGYSLTGSYFPKILGTYEKELHDTICKLDRFTFEQLVIVGAGEGYYAGGLSRRLGLSTVAYERTVEAAGALQELGSLNNINGIEFRGECKPSSLALMSKSLILMDIEGEEVDFLNEGVMEKNQDCYWIIEIHGNETKSIFLSSLGDTYKMEFIPCLQRKMEDFPLDFGRFRSWFFKRYWFSLLQEWRGGGQHGSLGWLVLEPKTQV